MSRLQPALERLLALDMSLCLSCNRLGSHPTITQLFRICSRLGDGVFWYSLMAVLPFTFGMTGLQAAGHMLVVGGISLVIYKWLKQRTVRPRPFAVNTRVTQRTLTLDQFSFPSGHTQHAVGFTLVALHYHPHLAPLLIPFATLVALSRPILGLHYPSDVLAGAALGVLVAGLGFLVL